MAAAAAMAGLTRCVRPPRPWPAFEIAVRGRGAALARLELVGVHREAHRAARLAPFEAGLDEDLVEPFLLGLVLHQARARHDQRVDAGRDLAALGDRGGGAQILDAAVGAGADEDASAPGSRSSGVPGFRPI